jgi:hypothetical protein
MGGATIAIWHHTKQKITTAGRKIGMREINPSRFSCHFVTIKENNDPLINNKQCVLHGLRGSKIIEMLFRRQFAISNPHTIRLKVFCVN